MDKYDIIVIGAGLTGCALAVELAQQNARVLLLEKTDNPVNATVLSYGGIAYWCGTDELTIKLCEEAIEIYRNLHEQLDEDVEFRDITLLFTIDKNQDVERTFEEYKQFYIKPEFLDVAETISLEPLINPEAIAGSLKFPQGHVNPSKLLSAYRRKLEKLGGKIIIDEGLSLRRNKGKIEGVSGKNNSYLAEKVVVCAGAFSRRIFQENGVDLPLYFSQAQVVKTHPSDIKLSTLVMPATTNRLDTEKKVAREAIWESQSDTIYGDVLEAGAIQFKDGSCCLGQISQIIPNLNPKIDAKTSEKRLREAIGKILPPLAQLPGNWYNCQVAFSKEAPFLVKEIPEREGLSVFSGFTSPFVFAPPLARHFAHYLVTGEDEIIGLLA
ncbi:MAG: FAD-binding oxidoreductase [Geminocystis sp.]|nr:FAD-binding oxidoreductase [Geminocystis sp.]MCS7148413.1 FAD-binding oxidoreductase [Geminocystis sp.]MCX8078272.1 FAD-binding oxidoreductase [Geminocystis sp.]MDW8115999.1 FAD-dependent oxidoreductase [Geminocystis sp.]MDW8463660.1 FAD-dependent oxidoreductase [Geminocystis sp.]